MATAVLTKGASGFLVTGECLDFIEDGGDGENSIIIKAKWAIGFLTKPSGRLVVG